MVIEKKGIEREKRPQSNIIQHLIASKHTTGKYQDTENGFRFSSIEIICRNSLIHS